MLKVDKKNYKKFDVYYIGYATVKKIANCNNINSVNSLYLIIDKMIGHFECNSVDEKNGNKYLVFDVKKEIEAISGGNKNLIWKKIFKN